jgi:hypothetical protein
MKYLVESSKFKEIDQICRKYGIKKYTLNGDGSIDVDGDVYLNNRELSKLPLKFGVVSVNFYCYGNRLTTLEGAPREVGANFNCSGNQLISLEGSPREVGAGFYCHYNQLISLEGAPREVGASFYCSYNQLTTLEGAPIEVPVDFSCHNNHLTSLKGAPKEVGRNFLCLNNPLPQLILDNLDNIKHIIKYQEDYSIWRRDGTLDEFRFGELMRDI